MQVGTACSTAVADVRLWRNQKQKYGANCTFELVDMDFLYIMGSISTLFNNKWSK